MNKWIATMIVVLGLAAGAGEYIGINEYTPTAAHQCVTLRRATGYAVQAVRASPSDVPVEYLTNTVEVYFTTTSNNIGADGGMYPEYKAVKLRDTDVHQFNTVGLYTGMCYYADTTPDGGVSAMKLRLFEVIN